MKLRRVLQSFPMSLAVLRTAAMVVPAHRRVEWLCEWSAELWHVRHACDAKTDQPLHSPKEITSFCLGAFKDALWLRRNDLPQDNPCSALSNMFQLASPSRCGLFLAGLAAVSMLIAYMLPGTRKLILPLPYPDAQSLVLISRSGHLSKPYPTVPLAEYLSWTTSTHSLFTEIAFYQPIVRRVHVARHRRAVLSIARASDNIFAVLHIPVLPVAPIPATHEYAAKLVLSRAAWRKYFHQDAQSLGRVVEIAGQPAIIVGIIPEDSWRLPGRVDAWLLVDKDHLAGLPSHSKGVVVAEIRTSAFPNPQSGQWQVSASNANGGSDTYDCISLTERRTQPILVFLLALAFACLALPATTSLSLGEYPAHRDRLHMAIGVRRWMFLFGKTSLVLVMVSFTAIDLADLSSSVHSVSGQYIQLVALCFGFLFGFRWVLRDQRKRCPVCLRLLTNPAHVGQSSRNFLAWNGTELICSGGHGLLHVPDLPTSWFSTQRWLYLDPSWSGLFSDVYGS